MALNGPKWPRISTWPTYSEPLLCCTWCTCRTCRTYYILLSCTLPHFAALCHTLPHFAALCRILPHFAALCHTLFLSGVCSLRSSATYCSNPFEIFSHNLPNHACFFYYNISEIIKKMRIMSWTLGGSTRIKRSFILR